MQKKKKQKRHQDYKYHLNVSLKPEPETKGTPGYTDDKGVEHFVVKVQVSLGGLPDCWVYSEDKSVSTHFEREVGEQLLLEDQAKGFFWAHIVGEGTLSFDEPAPWQDW